MRSCRKAADDAFAIQAHILTLIGRAAIDGSLSMTDVREALSNAPLAQDGGTAVTGAASNGVAPLDDVSGVGEGPAGNEGSARGMVDSHALEAGQAIAEVAASHPKSNPELAATLDKIPGMGLRNAVITLYHETDVSLEFIARTVGCDLKTVNHFIKSGRASGDARVLRGDDLRNLDLED